MSTNHIIQYFIIGIIGLFVIIRIIKYFKKIKQCHSEDSTEDICQCCSSKSLCGKKKKSNSIAK